MEFGIKIITFLQTTNLHHQEKSEDQEQYCQTGGRKYLYTLQSTGTRVMKICPILRCMSSKIVILKFNFRGIYFYFVAGYFSLNRMTGSFLCILNLEYY